MHIYWYNAVGVNKKGSLVIHSYGWPEPVGYKLFLFLKLAPEEGCVPKCFGHLKRRIKTLYVFQHPDT